jgi:hypothetical protein
MLIKEEEEAMLLAVVRVGGYDVKHARYVRSMEGRDRDGDAAVRSGCGRERRQRRRRHLVDDNQSERFSRSTDIRSCVGVAVEHSRVHEQSVT